MIINENLYEGKQRLTFPRQKGNFGYVTILSNEDIDNLENNKKYTVSLDLNQTENGSGYVNFGRLTKGGILQDSTKKSVKDRLELTFNKMENMRIVCYADLAGKTEDIGVEVFNIKLEFGDVSTQYIPNKSKVKPENQAVFVAGGVFQEVYPV